MQAAAAAVASQRLCGTCVVASHKTSALVLTAMGMSTSIMKVSRRMRAPASSSSVAKGDRPCTMPITESFGTPLKSGPAAEYSGKGKGYPGMVGHRERAKKRVSASTRQHGASGRDESPEDMRQAQTWAGRRRGRAGGKGKEGGALMGNGEVIRT